MGDELILLMHALTNGRWVNRDYQDIDDVITNACPNYGEMS